MAAVQRVRAASGGPAATIRLAYSTSCFEADADVRGFLAPRRHGTPARARRVGIVFESDFLVGELDDDASVRAGLRVCPLRAMTPALLCRCVASWSLSRRRFAGPGVDEATAAT
jgi:hypothetical protein